MQRLIEREKVNIAAYIDIIMKLMGSESNVNAIYFEFEHD